MSVFAQKSVLKLKTKLSFKNNTCVESLYFTPPLKIICPNQKVEKLELMLLSVSAGLMKDDEQDIVIEIGKQSKVKLCSQSYEKIHNTYDSFASKNSLICLKEGAFLQYDPLPVIAFANSSFKATTCIKLEKNSSLHYSEIFCAGRVLRNEIFAFKEFCSKLSIFRDEELILFDNLCLKPKYMALQNCCLFDGYTHYLSLILFDENLEYENLKQQCLASKLNIGISSLNGGIVVRALANTSESLIEFKESLKL
ncbi:urease accessory protein UreD [Campylobacter sp. MIT 21-1685]|uniref:urease accessory protein UreD n=1 Tax=unclassified Campylobacter TaxID=2593542 RepID=UPI00224B22EA|nr:MULTISPECIES: urease accessory protein UreD [unclassified Campylobacter]MCX2682891.1 urease accessory protein UreD [Campylobacter sp. MIT 21-1684]MCX2751161.1 urease accessory protein UreD [Campylobacter sp. MIT 21-1682]MCX2807372.1 urease accessory protein UreD [Campylobacter sp. MIT 21-1685]